jgi:hypothetical protein
MAFYIHKVSFSVGDKTGNNPTDRSKLGTKKHILTEKKGIPLSVVISPAANTHDIKLVTDASYQETKITSIHTQTNIKWRETKKLSMS